MAPRPTPGEVANLRVGPTSFIRVAFLSLLCIGILKWWCSTADTWRPTIRADVAMFGAEQFHVGCYCSAEVAEHEAIMTMIPEPSGRLAYGMHGNSVSAPLHHHFTVQCQLMSGTLAHLSVPGYAERAVWVRCAVPDGPLLAGEDKQGMEPSVRIHTHILLLFAPISFVFCTCFPSQSLATVHRHGR
jgi:hypothetical protein